MAFDIPALQGEIARSPLHSPYPLDVAIAIVDDCLRLAGKAPVAARQWERWGEEMGPLWPEQLGVLAHFLATTSLRSLTVDAIRRAGDLRTGLPHFFRAIAPLTAEMIRSNRFRQEELLRQWAAWCRGEIAGETPAQSQTRREELDYNKTLAEYKRAEAARKREEARRARLLKEAEERAAAARGWRE